MRTRIHVNQHNIRSGRGPVLTVKDYKRNRKGSTAVIRMGGMEVARIVYRPQNPLPCGAKCWVETLHPVEVSD